MNILFISDVFPRYHAPGGSPTRVYCFLKELSKSHQITLLTTEWPNVNIDISALTDFCRVELYRFCEKPVIRDDILVKVLGNTNRQRIRILGHLLSEYPQVIQSTIRHLPNFQQKLSEINLDSFDLIQIEVSNIAYRISEIRKINPRIPIVLDMHDIDSLIEQRKFNNASGFKRKTYSYIEWKKMIHYERKICGLFNKCLTVSENDKDLLLSICPSVSVSVIANGVDTDFFKNTGSNDYQPNSVFFVGGSWPPNEDAVLFFHKEIFPLVKQQIPDVKFYIVGGIGKSEKIAKLSDQNTVITGYVDDVRPWMEKCQVSIIPMRLGGGTKLKTLEALSMGKAVVSTSEGCEGIKVTNAKDILISDSPLDFANKVISLLEDESLCKELGKNGRNLVENNYDWKIIVDQLDQTYFETMKEK